MARVYKLAVRERSRLGIDYASVVNAEQKAVVDAAFSPLLVLAGAGSGKTRALTYRVARMIDKGVPPEGIVLLTFTNRAAEQMRERVEEICGASAKSVLAGTFHHVANVFLRRYADAIGYKPNFTILDRDDAGEVMAAAILDANVDVKKARFPKPDVVLGLSSDAINTETPVRDVVAKKAPRYFTVADEIAASCRAYIERKASMNLMDFDDLLMNLKVLLTDVPHIAKAIQDGVKAVLVDEYQDTNALQGSIVDLLAARHKNLTVVGDDAQCIYAFRGAHIENMLSFPERYPGAQVLPLTVNYRSTPEILELANASLRRQQHGFDKSLRAVRPAGPVPALVPCRDADMQADFIAQRILELHDEGVSFDEMGVLYRAHSNALEIQLALTRRKIPFIVRSGLRFFEQAHIKDVIAILKLVYNPHDELSFRRAVKLQEGVGNASADQLWQSLTALLEEGAQSFTAGLVDVLADTVGKRAKKGVTDFLKLLRTLSSPSMKAQPGEMIRTILASPPDGGGYGDVLRKSYPTSTERIDDIEQLADYAGGFTSLEELLSELSLLQSFQAEDVVAADDPDEKVTLSSIHQAKGLEWSRVFLPWLVEGRFPSDLALRDSGGEDEERRLFYVAVTRAKDELVLTYPMVHRGRDQVQTLLRRSRFVDELPEPEEISGTLTGLYEVWQIEEVDAPLLEHGDAAERLAEGIDDEPQGFDDDRRLLDDGEVLP
jgi:DNA helicase-2/ATP-dependent DNA helicase PcrA